MKAFLRIYPHFSWNETDQDRSADVDGILGVASNGHNIIQSVLEIKSRFDMDMAKLFNEYEGRWLISHDKLLRGYDLAHALRSDFNCMLVLKQDRRAFLRKIAKHNKDTGGLEWVADFEVRKTETQKSINGGTAYRDNAYIDMYNARMFDI